MLTDTGSSPVFTTKKINEDKMKQFVTIDLDDLRKIMREETINTLAEMMDMLREGEVIQSSTSLQKQREIAEMMADKNDKMLTGVQVAERLGCTSGQVTHLKNKGVLEPVYAFGSRTPRYSANKLEKMIRERTIPCYR